MSEPLQYDHEDKVSARPRRRLIRKLALPLLAFGSGIAATAYGLAHWDSAARWLGLAPATEIAASAVTASKGGIANPPLASHSTVADAESVQPEILHARIQAIEERLDRLSARTEATSGNANRAEGMLIAFAARRALDRGVQLGYLESLLRERFGTSQPQAVATIIAAGRERITLDLLATNFEKIAPDLDAVAANENWWDKLKRGMADLIIIRRGAAPSNRPQEILDRVRGQIANGEIDQALIEMTRLPQHAKAKSWISQARGYVMARNALDRIETAALIDPLGDNPPPARDGENVEPPPVSATAPSPIVPNAI